jgi:hypothetical protein
LSQAVRTQRDRHARAAFLRAVDHLDDLLSASAAAGTEVVGRRRQLAELKARLAVGAARVAVVGPVKSGKSTLLNALIGQDLLPRGSGVLTAQVTELRHGPRPAVDVEWTSPGDADAEFTRLLTALGHPGSWSLAEPGHRARARAAVSLAAAPPAAALAAMLDGYPTVRERLGTRQASLPLAEGGLAAWVTRDEVAIFLHALRVTSPSPRLPVGVALLDCQGYDAWNPWHGAELLAALQQAHAVVYVVSSRVGFRDADQRLLEQLQGLGLLRLTRFVLNVDWGEVRRPGDLQRVRDGVQRRITELAGGDLSQFSALQTLVEHLALVDPEALSAGESRLLDAWDADNTRGMAAGRRDFDSFCATLWHDAQEERDATVLQRLRADLRGLLVAAARELRHADGAGVRRLAWEEDAADRVLSWAQQRIDRVVADCRQRLGRQVREGFGARRAPQRQTWQRLVAAAMADPATLAPVDAALNALTRSEPLRVNAVRNLALEVRGELCRHAAGMAAEMAARLTQAGLEPGPPPTRAELAREISATRRIPLFATAATGALRIGGPGTPEPGRLLAAVVQRLGRAPEPAPAGRLGQMGRAAARGLVTTQLRGAWDTYLEQVLEQCLLPHAGEAAADLYAGLAAWVLGQLNQDARDRAELLAHCRAI